MSGLVLGVLLSTASLVGTPTPALAGPGLDQYYAEVPASTYRFSSGSGARIGNVLLLWSTGVATAWVDLARPTNRFHFSAEAQQCEGSPRLEVAIDDVTHVGREISGKGDYAATGNWAAGRHKVTLRFTNDLLTSSCDRNLKVRYTHFTGPRAVDAGPVWTWQDWNPLYASFDPASAGSHTPTGMATLWTNGSMHVRLDSQGANQLLVAITGARCSGLAGYRLTVDDEVVSEGPLPEPYWDDVPSYIWVTRTWPNVNHSIVVTMTDDLRTASCDRSLRIEQIHFSGLV